MFPPDIRAVESRERFAAYIGAWYIVGVFGSPANLLLGVIAVGV